MKLIHTADWHLGMENYGKFDPETGLSSRIADFLRTFDEVVDYTIDKKVDAFLFAGDVYKNREPTQTYQREFAKRVLKLAKNNIPVVLLVGNHDTPSAEAKANTLDIYFTLEIDNVFVVRKPSLITINDKLQIIGLPWLTKKDFEGLTDTLRSFYEKLNSKLPTVTMVHGTVEGSVFGSERSIYLGKDFIIPLNLLTHPQVSYVALGHIHKRQILSENPPVLYPGSLERIDFGEEKEPKSFELVNIDNHHKASHEPIAVSARPFKTIEINIPESTLDPTELVIKNIEGQDLSGAVVKLVLNLTSATLEQLRPDAMKKELEKKAYVVAGITKNVERSIRQRLENVSAEELTPFEALQKYFEPKNYPPEKIAILENKAKEIIEEIVK